MMSLGQPGKDLGQPGQVLGRPGRQPEDFQRPGVQLGPGTRQGHLQDHSLGPGRQPDHPHPDPEAPA